MNMKQKVLNLIMVFSNWVINTFGVKPWLSIRLLTDLTFINSPSYYPEKKRKSKLCIVFDNLVLIWKYARIEEFYFAYGMDVKGADIKSFVDYNEFSYWRDKLNKQKGKPFEYTGILRDKFVFNLFSTGLSFPSSSMIGLIFKGTIFQLAHKKEMPLSEYFDLNNVDAFCKAIDAEDGKSIYHIVSNNGKIYINGTNVSIDFLLSELGNVRWTIEHKIIQHPEYAKFNPCSVNTLRIYTVRDVSTGEIRFLPSIFRVGAWGNNVDNWARGGLIIRIYEDGSLGEYGFFRPKYGTKATIHPDTGIVFKGQKLPFAKESFEFVKKMHHYLYGIHSIGWDIAVTESGPIVVEANDNWEISALQIASKGCQKEFDLYFKG